MLCELIKVRFRWVDQGQQGQMQRNSPIEVENSVGTFVVSKFRVDKL
jgi:hypothetical protein